MDNYTNLGKNFADNKFAELMNVATSLDPQFADEFKDAFYQEMMFLIRKQRKDNQPENVESQNEGSTHTM